MLRCVFICMIIGLVGVACSCVDIPAVNSESNSEFNDESYLCDRGTEIIQVRFYLNKDVAVLTRKQQILELTREPAASGFLYAMGSTTMRGKGEDLTLTIGRMVPLQCKRQH